QGLFFYLIAYLICKFCHELGHAYMCRHYGIPVPTLGIAFLVFWPVLYTDTTLSWSLNHRQRLRIALAGIWSETYVTIIAALIWCNVHNLTIQAICYVTITINWLASVFINISPFMRFDGYYVLADYLKMPNLQPRAFALARWQIRHWLFHWPDPPPEKFSSGMHNFLVAYAITTWIYRLTVYFGIALLVYHFFIKAVGIILFAVEMFYFILGPIVREIQTWIVFKDKFEFNTRTKFSIFLVFLTLLFILLPINEAIKLPGTLSYKHQFLIAPAEGILQNKLPAVGSAIKANQPIVVIRSPDLDYSLQQLQLEYQKKLNELRRSSIEPQFAAQKNVLLSDISKQQAKYRKLFDLRSKFTLSAPFNGVLIDTAAELYPGAVIKKDEWLGDVIQTNTIQGEAYVSQYDVNMLKTGLTGTFYPKDLSAAAVPVKVISIEVLNSNKLNCRYSGQLAQDKNVDFVVETPCYNASELGGDIATFLTDEGEYVPVNSMFRVLLAPTKPIKLNHVERGTIVIDTKPTSYAYWFFYKLKTIVVQQAGF
ncbi:MAG: efflux RND transporter periplasmic adaptor subunit, partial [Gammaproteobacteria bacterium]